MLKRALPLLLACLAGPVSAYNSPEHEDFAGTAAAAACAAAPGSAFCSELGENLPFLLYGAVREDEAPRGHDAVFNGVRFSEEEPGAYGPCREYVVAGKSYMYCNHYFFVTDYLAGGAEGSCGSRMTGATDNLCEGKDPFRWESARQRGLRLWKEKVLPNYFSGAPDGRARAYYWLGRVAHLLADVAVPAHVIPHKIGYVEFEHRVFEYEAGRSPIGALPDAATPGTVDGLFTGLAVGTLRAHDESRSAECRREPAVSGCDRGRASPTRPLESRLTVKNLLLTDAIMKAKPGALGKPEIARERRLAAAQLAVIKPLTAAYTAALLRLFAVEAALQPRGVDLSSLQAEIPPGRAVDFDGALR